MTPDYTVTAKDMSGVWAQFMGISQQGDGIPAPSGLREYANAPATEAWVYSCVRRLFTSAQSVPLRVYVKRGKDLVRSEDAPRRGDAQDLQFLLDNINPISMNGADFRGYTAAGIQGVWGGAYWKKVRGRRGGPTQELYWLPATDLTPEKDPAIIGAVRRYTYAPAGTTLREEYSPKDVLAFRAFNFTDPVALLSPLSAARYEIATNRMAGQQMAATLANWNIPPGAWVIPKGEEISTQDEGLIRRALRALRGPRNQGKTPILPAGLEWKALALNPKDAEWLAARKVSRLTVCAVTGVPLLLAGDDESTGPYAYAREIWRMFWQGTMIPLLDQVADVLNGWLVPEFTSKGDLVCAFDYTEIEALQVPIEERKRVAIEEVKNQILTRDEYRAHYLALDPLPESEMPEPEPAPGEPEAAEPEAAEPEAGDEDAADAVRPQKDIYTHPAVVAWLADPSQPLDADSITGRPVSGAVRSVMQQGLRRRYSAAQIADGFAREGYAGIRGTR